MLTTIRRYSFLLTALILAATGPTAQASTHGGFDTSGSATMPFAINGGDEVMNLQADGLHFDSGKVITGLDYLTTNGITVASGVVTMNSGGINVSTGAISVANGTISSNAPSGSWGGVFRGPEYGVYASGSTWAGYFDGPVNIASGGLHFPDGSIQTTAAVGGAVSSPTGGGNWSQTDLGWHSFCALSFLSSSGRLGGSVRVWTDQQSGNRYHWLLTTQGGGSQWVEHTAANCIN